LRSADGGGGGGLLGYLHVHVLENSGISLVERGGERSRASGISPQLNKSCETTGKEKRARGGKREGKRVHPSEDCAARRGKEKKANQGRRGKLGNLGALAVSILSISRRGGD